jgi:Ca2+/Na+ antiporter
MDSGTIGLIGGIVGSVIGILGGIIGTYFSVKITKTAAERRFVAKCALAVWVVGTVLIGLPLALWLVGAIPQWLYWVTFALFYVLLVPTIFWTNKHQVALRKEKQSISSEQ